jgi:predicted nucleic acid-binding protein
VAAHSIAEIYAKLTRIRFTGRMLTAKEVRRVLADNIESVFSVISLSGDDYVTVVDSLAEKNLVGGIIYDALIVYAGIKAGADHILTLNPRHFRAIYPIHAGQILDPTEMAEP